MDANFLAFLSDMLAAINGVVAKHEDKFDAHENPYLGKIPVYYYDELVGEIRDEIGGPHHAFYAKVGDVQS